MFGWVFKAIWCYLDPVSDSGEDEWFCVYGIALLLQVIRVDSMHLHHL